MPIEDHDFITLKRLLPEERHVYVELESAFNELLDDMRTMVLLPYDAAIFEGLAGKLRRLGTAMKKANVEISLHQWEASGSSEHEAKQLLKMGEDTTAAWTAQILNQLSAYDESRWRKVQRHVARFRQAILINIEPRTDPPAGSEVSGLHQFSSVGSLCRALHDAENLLKAAEECQADIRMTPERAVVDCYNHENARRLRARASDLFTAVRCLPAVDQLRTICVANYHRFNSDSLWRLICYIAAMARTSHTEVEGWSLDAFLKTCDTVRLPLGERPQLRGGNAKAPSLRVGAWADLAIGIDAKRKYFAISPPPQTGDRVKKSDWVTLPLSGARWESLLDAVASSPTGRVVGLQTLAKMWDYLPSPSTYTRDPRARRDAEVSGQNLSVGNAVKTLQGRVGDALRDLARELRRFVEGPGGKGQVYRREKGEVDFEFIVRHFLPDDSGQLYFGPRVQA